MSKSKSWYYSVQIQREGHIVTRQGNVHAPWPLQALDEIQRMARDEWNRPLVHIDLYDLSCKPMELVATTDFGDAGGRTTAFHHTSETKKQLPKVVGEVSHGVKKPNDDWRFYGGDIGEPYKAPSYATLKIGD